MHVSPPRAKDAPAASTATRRTATRRTAPLDAAIAVTAALVATGGVWAELGAWPHPIAFPAGAYLLSLAGCAALLWRRAHPLACTAVVVVCIAAYHAAGYPGGAPVIPLFIALYSMAAYSAAAWWTGVAAAVAIAWQAIPALPPTPTPWYSYATLGPVLGLLSAVALGAFARQSRLASHRAVAAAAAESSARTAERLAEQRLAIARDVHDVLAHTLSAITVQSAVALDAFDRDPERSREAMGRVRTLARQSMPELHRTLEALRGTPATPPPPQPHLDALDALIEPVRQAGIAVSMSEHGVDEVGPVVGLCAYRIVQEALTNVLRHSNAHAVEVSLRAGDGMLNIEVANDGVAPAAPPGPTDGFGTRGMRERAAVVGGTVESGPQPGGGFLVRAQLPFARVEEDRQP